MVPIPTAPGYGASAPVLQQYVTVVKTHKPNLGNKGRTSFSKCAMNQTLTLTDPLQWVASSWHSSSR
jgi:hypothetical protein